MEATVIPKGSRVLLKWFSSNHDESMFEAPMEFDITRANAKRHMAFGFGTHVCIGQHLSRAGNGGCVGEAAGELQ